MLKQGFLKVYARYSYLENRVQTHSKEPTQMHRIEASTLGPSLFLSLLQDQLLMVSHPTMISICADYESFRQ